MPDQLEELAAELAAGYVTRRATQILADRLGLEVAATLAAIANDARGRQNAKHAVRDRYRQLRHEGRSPEECEPILIREFSKIFDAEKIRDIRIHGVK